MQLLYKHENIWGYIQIKTFKKESCTYSGVLMNHQEFSINVRFLNSEVKTEFTY